MTTKYNTFNGQRIAMRDETGLTYLHTDQLGSTALTTNGSGATLDDHGYNAYGKDRRGSELRTAQRFTGQQGDATGLLYYGARYYDPQLGQFISPDTLVPDASNLFDYNRYMYARGNPMKYNDPDGHQATLPMPSTPDYWQAVENLINDSQALGPEGPMLAAAAIAAPVASVKAVEFVLNEPSLNYPSPYPNADIGNGNISVTIPVPGSTTLTTPGVPLTSDNQTSLTGVTPVNSPAQQLVEPLPAQQKGSNLVSANFKFPNASQLAKRLGASEREFHREIKDAITTDFSQMLAKAGIGNPDIGINGAGNIVFKDRRTGKVIETDVPLDSYKVQ